MADNKRGILISWIILIIIIFLYGGAALLIHKFYTHSVPSLNLEEPFEAVTPLSIILLRLFQLFLVVVGIIDAIIWLILEARLRKKNREVVRNCLKS